MVMVGEDLSRTREGRGGEIPVKLSPALSRRVPPDASGACRVPRLSGNKLLSSPKRERERERDQEREKERGRKL
jgi:hypothetical protein